MYMYVDELNNRTYVIKVFLGNELGALMMLPSTSVLAYLYNVSCNYTKQMSEIITARSPPVVRAYYPL